MRPGLHLFPENLKSSFLEANQPFPPQKRHDWGTSRASNPACHLGTPRGRNTCQEKVPFWAYVVSSDQGAESGGLFVGCRACECKVQGPSSASQPVPYSTLLPEVGLVPTRCPSALETLRHLVLLLESWAPATFASVGVCLGLPCAAAAEHHRLALGNGSS